MSDILLITVDTLRADHLSAWGYERPTSPTLDRLAREGAEITETGAIVEAWLGPAAGAVAGRADGRAAGARRARLQ